MDQKRQVVESFLWFLYTDELNPDVDLRNGVVVPNDFPRIRNTHSTESSSGSSPPLTPTIKPDASCVECRARVICNLLVLSHVYLLPRLSKLCCHRLVSEQHSLILPHLAGKLFQAAVDAQELGLKQFMLGYIFDNYGLVMREHGLDDMHPEAMREFLNSVPPTASLQVGVNQTVIVGRGRSNTGPRRS